MFSECAVPNYWRVTVSPGGGGGLDWAGGAPGPTFMQWSRAGAARCQVPRPCTALSRVTGHLNIAALITWYIDPAEAGTYFDHMLRKVKIFVPGYKKINSSFPWDFLDVDIDLFFQFCHLVTEVESTEMRKTPSHNWQGKLFSKSR